jgi:hypothetical protein
MDLAPKVEAVQTQMSSDSIQQNQSFYASFRFVRLTNHRSSIHTLPRFLDVLDECHTLRPV